MRVPGKAQSCAALIQIALILTEAVPRSSDPGGVTDFTRDTAGLLHKAPQGQLVPQTSPEPHSCWTILLGWKNGGRDGV